MAGAQSSSPSSSTPVSSQMRGPPESKGDNRTDSNQEGKGKGKENEKGNKTVETSGPIISTTDAGRKDAGKKAGDVVGVQSSVPSPSTPVGSQIRRSSESKGNSGTDSLPEGKGKGEEKYNKMVETSAADLVGVQSSGPGSSTPSGSQIPRSSGSKGDSGTHSHPEGKGKGKGNEMGNKMVETSARDVAGAQSSGRSPSTPVGSQIRRSSKLKGDSGTDSNHQPKSNEESKGEKMVETSGSGTSTINDSRKFAE